MIPLIVALCLCFAWACIATATAVARSQAADLWERCTKEADAHRGDLLLQLSARNAGEYAAAKHIAMRPFTSEMNDEKRWAYDDTGLIRSPAAPADDDDTE